MTVDQRRFCQELGCTNELPISSMDHRKFCNPCNIIKRRERIRICIANKKQREKENQLIVT